MQSKKPTHQYVLAFFDLLRSLMFTEGLSINALKLGFFATLFLLVNFSYSQGTVRLSVLDGGNVNFYFNSLTKYNSGITYTDYTVLGITCDDDDNPTNGYNWTLEVKALTAQFDGDGGNTLPLSTLEITPSKVAGLPFAALSGTIVLTNVDQTLASEVILNGAPAADEPSATTDQVGITYECGTTVPLLLEPADYYVVDLEYTLTANF